MNTLVDSPEVQIKVHSILGYTVCIKCRGRGVWRIAAHQNLDALRTGGVYAIWNGKEEWCRACDGIGYWRVK